MLVRELCTKDVSTIPVDASVRDAAEVMAREAVGCLVVTDRQGQGVGVVTDRDLAIRAVAASSSDVRLATVDTVMSEPLLSVEPDAPVDDTIKRMRTAGVRRMPVCEGGVPVGILALDDVLEMLAESLHDLSTETGMKRRRARRHARYQNARERIEELVDETRQRLECARWYATETIGDEIDELRTKVENALKRLT